MDAKLIFIAALLLISGCAQAKTSIRDITSSPGNFLDRQIELRAEVVTDGEKMYAEDSTGRIELAECSARSAEKVITGVLYSTANPVLYCRKYDASYKEKQSEVLTAEALEEAARQQEAQQKAEAEIREAERRARAVEYETPRKSVESFYQRTVAGFRPGMKRDEIDEILGFPASSCGAGPNNSRQCIYQTTVNSTFSVTFTVFYIGGYDHASGVAVEVI